MELEIIVIGTFLFNIGAFLISRRIFVNSFPIQPLIERAAVIKHTVQNHFHAPSVRFLYHLGKKRIAGLQILLIGNTVNISGGKAVFRLSVLQQVPFIMHNFPKMRVDIIIVLNIVFMVGGGYKQRIKINHIHAQIL